MSQGQGPASAGINGESAQTAGSTLHALLRQGRSFSGRERNCCFLNTGTESERFADVSAVSGFDFPDDARALASVDWDHDGDLDFWVSNRSGPQVRFLLNTLESGAHSLSLRLVGTRSNRDAVGARVRVIVPETAQQQRVQTVRAGNGFLAQSSKWLHFGLGDTETIERIEVRWPNGNVEEFTGATLDGRYNLIEGSGRVQAAPRRQPISRAKWFPGDKSPSEKLPSPAPAPTSRPALGGTARLVSAARLPLPALDYTSFDGTTFPVLPTEGDANARPATLLLLWATWCPPCQAELRELSAEADRLRAAGLRVLALSVDPLDEASTVTPAHVQALLEKLDFPFPAGMARETTLGKLRLVYERLFDLHKPFPVPIGFLVNASGELAVIYRGRTTVQQLLADVARLRRGGADLLPDALPFSGRWLRPPGRLSPFALAWELATQGYAPEAASYVEDHRALLAGDVQFPRLLVLLGNHKVARARTTSAIALYREALSLDSSSTEARNNLAWLLATASDPKQRDSTEAVRLAKAALAMTRGADPSVWDTLAAAHAAAGHFEAAVAAAQEGLKLAHQNGRAGLAKSLGRRLALYQAGKPFRRE